MEVLTPDLLWKKTNAVNKNPSTALGMLNQPVIVSLKKVKLIRIRQVLTWR